MSALISFLREESGDTVQEYGLIAAIMAVSIPAAISLIGGLGPRGCRQRTSICRGYAAVPMNCKAALSPLNASSSSPRLCSRGAHCAEGACQPASSASPSVYSTAHQSVESVLDRTQGWPRSLSCKRARQQLRGIQ